MIEKKHNQGYGINESSKDYIPFTALIITCGVICVTSLLLLFFG